MKIQIKDFDTTGIANVKYPKTLRKSVEEAVSLWEKFCDLPESEKRLVPYSSSSTGVGYELKDGVGKGGDRKENFDITIPGESWVTENAKSFKSPDALRFVKKVGELVTLMKPLIVEFAKEVEKQFGLEGFTREVSDSDSAFFVRFIHYFGDRKVGEEIATSHVDQSGFTLHLYESAEGFECLMHSGKNSGKWIRVPVTAGNTVIIPSMQLQLVSTGLLRAMCHRVVATEKTAPKGRYSAVCFVQLKNTPQYDKAKSGRLQEKEPGFNYEMPIGEFKRLFK